MRVSEALQPFLAYCQAERHVAPSTLQKYQDCFQSWLLPCLGKEDLLELNRMHILGLRKAMVDRGLSIARQYSIIMCLKTFLKFCKGTLGASCLDAAEVRLPRRATPVVEFLTNVEIQRMLDTLKLDRITDLRLRALIEVILSTGMRISEALSLRREQFESGASEAEIIGKGKRKRTVFFTPRCRLWVQQYLERRLDNDQVVFATTGYPVRPLKREDVSRFFRNLRTKAGITKKLTPHVLRHTFCTNLRDHGADISYIKDLAGHQDIHTTAKYYLGKDKTRLRQVVAQCLDYGPTAGLENIDPSLMPGADSATKEAPSIIRG